MICKVCGREIANENANFCEYCGSSVRDGSTVPMQEFPAMQNAVPQQEDKMYRDADGGGTERMFGRVASEAEQDKEPVIPFGNWMITLLLPLIPMIGPLVYIVMLFVWAFGKTGSRTKRNWSRAQLIMLVVSMIMLGTALAPIMNQLMGGAAGAGMF